MKKEKEEQEKQKGPGVPQKNFPIYELNNAILLGRGSFGKVYKYKGRAVKQIQTNSSNFNKDLLLTQIKIHQTINNQPNIVKMYDAFYCNGDYYIILQLCQNSLRNYMQKIKYFEQSQAYKIMKQIVSGYRVLIQHNIIHRDIKPDNILMNSINQIKLADFGASRILQNTDQYQNNQLYTVIGTPLYQAPQLIYGQKYTPKSDIFSLGIIYYQLLMNQTPWTARSMEILKSEFKKPITYINRQTYKQIIVSQKVKKFIESMLKINAEQRCGWEEVFQYFNVNNNSILSKIKNKISKLKRSKSTIHENQQNNKQNSQNLYNTQRREAKKLQAIQARQINNQRQKQKSKAKVISKPISKSQGKIIVTQEQKTIMTISERFLKGMIQVEFLLFMSKQQARELNKKSYPKMSSRQKQIFQSVLRNFNQQVRSILKNMYKYKK